MCKQVEISDSLRSSLYIVFLILFFLNHGMNLYQQIQQIVTLLKSIHLITLCNHYTKQLCVFFSTIYTISSCRFSIKILSYDEVEPEAIFTYISGLILDHGCQPKYLSFRVAMQHNQFATAVRPLTIFILIPVQNEIDSQSCKEP